MLVRAWRQRPPVNNVHAGVVIDVDCQRAVGSDERVEHLAHGALELAALADGRLQLLDGPPEAKIGNYWEPISEEWNTRADQSARSIIFTSFQRGIPFRKRYYQIITISNQATNQRHPYQHLDQSATPLPTP